MQVKFFNIQILEAEVDSQCVIDFINNDDTSSRPYASIIIDCMHLLGTVIDSRLGHAFSGGKHKCGSPSQTGWPGFLLLLSCSQILPFCKPRSNR